jgi:hypothetical protein
VSLGLNWFMCDAYVWAQVSYDFNLPGSDGQVRGLPAMYCRGDRYANEMSFINDVRGSGLSRHNVAYLQTLVNGWPALVLVALQHINKGAELLTDYGR